MAELIIEAKTELLTDIFTEKRPDYVIVTKDTSRMDACQEETFAIAMKMIGERNLRHDRKTYDEVWTVLPKGDSTRRRDYNINVHTPEIEARLAGDGTSMEGKSLLYLHFGPEFRRYAVNPVYRRSDESAGGRYKVTVTNVWSSSIRPIRSWKATADARTP